MKLLKKALRALNSSTQTEITKAGEPMDNQAPSQNRQRAFSHHAGKAIFPALLIATTAFGVLAFDTTWVGTGKPISAASLQANLTEIQARLVAAEHPSFIKLAMSVGQQCSLAVEDTIQFGSVAAARGMTSSSNGIDLKAGHTYRVESIVNTYPANGGYLGYQFALGGARVDATAYTGNNTVHGFHAGLLSYFTPAADTNVTVKVMNPNLGPSGCAMADWNSYLIATDLN